MRTRFTFYIRIMKIQDFLNVITPILFVMFLGGLNSLLSYFLDYCFWDGSIFGKYIPWLAKTNLKIFKPDILKALESSKESKDYNNKLVQSAQNIFFFKILGGCAICSNIWLGGITFTILSIFFGLSPFLCFPYLLFSSFLLRKIIG